MIARIETLEHRQLLDGSILFVRGADRSGGFIEATNDAQRTEQLADITNASTANGNHGWKQLHDLLVNEGYTVTQIIEPLEAGAPGTGQTTGAPIAFETMDLSQYDAIVMASNNAVYTQPQIDAIEAYIRNGGGVLFISDGNFGSNWRDAPDSDTQFLSRFGMAVNQDNGTYSLTRAGGDFVEPNHAILFDVDEFDGEGVSPIRIGTPPPDVTIRRIVAARGTTYDNNGANPADDYRGTQRPVDANDAALVLAKAGAGRIAAHFDRNTFFNTNGAGTDITRFDNAQLAKNLFRWVTDNDPPYVMSSDFQQSSPYVLTFRMSDNMDGTMTRDDFRVRNRRTGINLPGNQWTYSITEGNGYTDVTITIKSTAPLGPYQLRAERRTMADAAGNVRNGAIRYNFTLLPLARQAAETAQTTSPASAPQASATDDDSGDRTWLMSLFHDD